MSKTKIVLSGLIYPFTMLHFFWRALERRDDVELCVVGPYTGDYIPWNHGIRLATKYVKVPDIALPMVYTQQSNIDSRFVEVQLPWDRTETDLWIQCDAGWHFGNRPQAKVTALIQTDPHVLKEQYRRPQAYSDVSFCMQMPYMDGKDIYLPYAFDPDIHFPENKTEEYDACLIGLHYETRNQLVAAIQQRGYRVYYSIGEVYDDYRRLYNASKTALSWSSLNDLPARVWEAMGMDIPLLTNRVPDLNNFFVDGEHYFGFSTLPEAIEKFVYMMNNPEIAQTVADAAYRKVWEAHTWDHRVQQILEVCKFK